ncbi:acetoacetate--CoA ligase [Desulfothermus okinawensis JCM 13304]
MGKLLWKPSEDRVKNSNMFKFLTYVNERFNKSFSTYSELWEWSVTDISNFWAAVWDFVKIIYSRDFDEVVDDPHKMPGAKWFSGAKMNFAENLLRYNDDHLAIIAFGEDREKRTLTYKELNREVARVAKALKQLGIQPGDRVVGYMPNIPETIIAMLAAASLGATWSSCSPDFGIKGVLDRFGQIKPRVLFTADGYSYKGKKIDSISRVIEVLKQIDSVEKVVVVPFLEENPDISGIKNGVFLDEFKSSETDPSLDFVQLSFSHPHYIMYSSGTTGLPKCMVQSAGGVLINHLKELILHTDLSRDDKIFYFTTCGWMMWNWLVSSLAVGATVVLYDGNPFYPSPKVLWEMAEDVKLSVFGTSAGYISALQNAKVRPKDEFDLSSLRAVLSTGSPLPEEGFEYVYDAIKEDLQLSSISGGTDLNGCFALGNPILPVYSGELQCRGLGMKVYAYDENGKPVYNKKGELVCTAPFPSMPLYFWNDPDGKKYHSAYFDVYPGVWRHGDFIEINDRGGVIIYGRSDATLNPGGVRIGTAEIYRQVEQFEEIEDSLVVGQNWKNDVRVILFVKMNPGYKLDDDLKNRLKRAIRNNASPRHVPDKIIEVPDIPYTLNMKKVEIAVRKVIHNEEVKNKDALRNPESLDYFKNIPELNED